MTFLCSIYGLFSALFRHVEVAQVHSIGFWQAEVLSVKPCEDGMNLRFSIKVLPGSKHQMRSVNEHLHESKVKHSFNNHGL